MREDWLTSLVVRDVQGLNQSQLAKALGAYLPLTPHLRRLDISSESGPLADEFVNGLAQNNTIQELDIACTWPDGFLKMVLSCFWSLAGIVNEEVVCNPPQPGACIKGASEPPQLDSLGPYMLDRIRSFLMIADILDDEEYDEDKEHIKMDDCTTPPREIP
ncbi:hypothetical protein V5799_003239 [Amblyomma americanum]|uniref:Uncharacterized protein n=1 Tax=Amblyomma americanum TaxID=6943 RepID=A0AAQ4D9I9_AMBAM